MCVMTYNGCNAAAYPVEMFGVVGSNQSSLCFSWEAPSIRPDLTTGYTLTCSPLLDGIPVPCGIVTVSSQGSLSSAPLSL